MNRFLALRAACLVAACLSGLAAPLVFIVGLITASELGSWGIVGIFGGVLFLAAAFVFWRWSRLAATRYDQAQNWLYQEACRVVAEHNAHQPPLTQQAFEVQVSALVRTLR